MIKYLGPEVTTVPGAPSSGNPHPTPVIGDLAQGLPNELYVQSFFILRQGLSKFTKLLNSPGWAQTCSPASTWDHRMIHHA